MLVTQGVLILDGIHPVLVPDSLRVSTNLTGSGIDDGVPSIVLERVVVLTTQVQTQLGATIFLSISPSVAVSE
jgi:hypothetical protein